MRNEIHTILSAFSQRKNVTGSLSVSTKVFLSTAEGMKKAGRPYLTFSWLAVVFLNSAHSVRPGGWTPCRYSSTLLCFSRGVK